MVVLVSQARPKSQRGKTVILKIRKFSDVTVKSINHASYCLVITDDCTRFCWVFFLDSKDETSGILQTFIRQIENQSSASGEEQVDDISPNTLEAAKTLSKVASLKPRSIDKGRRYKRRKEAKGKKVVSSLDFQEEVDAGAEQVNTAEGVNTGSIKLSTVSEQLSTGNEQVSTVGAEKSTSSQDKGQREG
ncbi:hypothetical protein Tco_0293786, partial [Tanacetum coccineum]